MVHSYGQGLLQTDIYRQKGKKARFQRHKNDSVVLQCLLDLLYRIDMFASRPGHRLIVNCLADLDFLYCLAPRLKKYNPSK